MSILEWLFEAQIQFGSKSITYREIIGGLLGLASAVLGLKRKVLAWPVGRVAHLHVTAHAPNHRRYHVAVHAQLKRTQNDGKKQGKRDCRSRN